MNCREFQKSINDFIFDKIEYADDVESFVKHFKECKSCNEDLRLYYNVRRGLEDVESPLIHENPKDINEELDLIMSYYDEHFSKEKIKRKLFNLSMIIIAIGLVCGIVYLWLEIK